MKSIQIVQNGKVRIAEETTKQLAMNPTGDKFLIFLICVITVLVGKYWMLGFASLQCILSWTIGAIVVYMTNEQDLAVRVLVFVEPLILLFMNIIQHTACQKQGCLASKREVVMPLENSESHLVNRDADSMV